MNALIFDTTRESLTIILVKEDIGYPFVGKEGMKRHTSSILAGTEKLLADHKLAPKDIDALGVVTGPGSFTGIRIGVATVNAFSFATGAKVVEMTALEPSAHIRDSALVLIDCNHNNFYALKKDANTFEYLALSGEETEEIDLPKVYANEANVDELVRFFLYKVKNGLFSKRATPFYIKKSSAEL
ncbi:MAG: tRNA (adenosine(37)-N6)-threonylcarbamoyltransferase complex dimerization subunit type 1 TsaB [Clostridia bacterium]